ncbi:hypothetical protein YEP4_07180 [Yersinia enterocolitica subsp. palearctica YE-P4]|nr:hypothetical protein IOK_15867 [Yersinia enterocolitica subsp. palearctica PhRBD_Ye1]EKN4918405.1 hypothetical protein [Yersinia enterocolitica]EOR68383.1 hypothetical protein YE149_07255 [Yersinia enterocolitica subsp. palearctica YE-149]EOR77357.1 hypothetical protein YE150_07210 [Yersinia enterocolitica subsp. palearctica YE-150]EOR77543.1 hypothetical protein YEP1_07270 [Yersinia enterocolitica subsp. palearctica YE-P1]EOR82529.1 hypothetical protein YEP4_07180 [Yersinia enterocolitica 
MLFDSGFSQIADFFKIEAWAFFAAKMTDFPGTSRLNVSAQKRLIDARSTYPGFMRGFTTHQALLQDAQTTAF